MKYTLLFVFSFLASSSFGQFYYEDFENGVPDEWTAENAWMGGTATTLSSSSFNIVDHGRFVGVNDDVNGATFNGSGLLISPKMDLSTLDDSYAISFEAYFLNSDFQGKDETAKLLASTDGGQNWTELYDIPESFEWQGVNVSLGSLAGQSEVWFAFEYDDGKGWNYGVAIDDVQIRQIFGRNIAVTDFSMPKYVPNDGDLYMDITIMNIGIEEVQTFDVVVDYKGNVFTINSGSPPLKFEEEFSFQVQVPFDYSETEFYDFDFVINNINGSVDLDQSNNSGNLNFATVADPPKKVTVGEEGTGTWCGWCPRGAVALDLMKEQYHDDFIGIAVHNGDPMVLAEYDDKLGVSGFPGMFIDRKLLIDPGEVEQYHIPNAKLVTPIGVDFEFDYNENSRFLQVFPSATIHTRLIGDYRFSVIITEDEVRGTGGAYDQANYYSNSQDLIDIHGLNWRDLPDPVPAEDMVYNEVGRAIIGGFEGIPMSIGDDLNNGDAVSYQIDYLIPAELDENNLNIVVIAIDALTGEVLNGKQKELFKTSSINEWPESLLAFNIQPNPAKDFANIQLQLNEASEVQVDLLDLFGRKLSSSKYGSLIGEKSINLNLENTVPGMYFVNILIDNQSVTRKLIVE